MLHLPIGRMGIYTEDEMKSHYDIKLEKYCQVINIEVNTMIEMVNKDIIPAMDTVRSIADKIEPLLGEEFKPYPSYEDLLYSVQ